IRRAGADTAVDDIVIHSGELVTPALIALAASCGISTIPIFPTPTIALAVGGDEVIPVEVGASLQPGQIFDSNSPMLIALFQTWGIQPVFLGRMPDNPAAMLEFFHQGTQYNILITVGGVSMGEHDYIRPCLAQLGAHEYFWKINQQPGGPMLFAQIDNTLVFG